MRRFLCRTGFALALGCGMATLPGYADDETKSPGSAKPAPATKAIDWSRYAFVTDIVGEIVKADDKSLTVRVTWVAPVANKNTTRPALHHNSRNFHHPHTPYRPNAQFKQQHHDYAIDYAPEGLVRIKAMPTKLNDDGKRVQLSTKEIQEYRTPPGAPSYAASKSDLIPGAIVEVIVVREKSVAADKVTEADLRVKYAIIQGQDPNPPKDISNPPAAKKKN